MRSGELDLNVVVTSTVRTEPPISMIARSDGPPAVPLVPNALAPALTSGDLTIDPDDGVDWGALMPPHQIKAQIEHVVSVAFSVTIDDLRRPSRGPAEAAFARQIAMYLAHVCCHWTFTEVGRLFDRDRTTVAHGCALVEDHRDDPGLDRALDWLERVVKRLAEPWRSEPGVSVPT